MLKNAITLQRRWFSNSLIDRVFWFLICAFFVTTIYICIRQTNYMNITAFWGTTPDLVLPIVLMGLIAFLLIYLTTFISSNPISVHIEMILLIVLLFSAFLIRLVSINFFQTYPISDFMTAHKNAELGPFPPTAFADLNDYQSYMGRFTSWTFYAITLKSLYSIFGFSVTIAKMANIFIATICVALIYFTIKNLTSNRRAAMIAAVVYAFWPSIICFSGVLAPDNFAVLFLTLLVFLLSLVHLWRQRHLVRTIILYGLAGLCAGLFSAYRAFGSILVVAVFLAELLSYILPAIHSHRVSPSGFLKKTLLLSIAGLCIFQVANIGVSKIKSYSVETYSGASGYYSSFKTTLYSSLLTGLNPATTGTWDPDVFTSISELVKKYGDSPILENKIQELYEEKYDGVQINYLSLFYQKAKISWGDDVQLLAWAQYNSDGALDARFAPINELMVPYSQIYYLFVILLSLLGAVLFFFKRSNLPMFVVSGFLIAFALMSLFVEVQPRYKVIVYPYLALLCGYGYILMQKLSKRRFNRKKLV